MYKDVYMAGNCHPPLLSRLDNVHFIVFTVGRWRGYLETINKQLTKARPVECILTASEGIIGREFEKLETNIRELIY